MKKVFKKLSAVIVALGIVATVFGSTSAFAASNNISNPFTLNGNFSYSGTAYEYTADDANNVYATLSMPAYTQAYPVFTTQRLVGGTWTNVESIYGPLAWYDSNGTGHHDSAIAFNGYAYKGTYIRVRVDLYQSSNYTGLLQTEIGSSWLR